MLGDRFKLTHYSTFLGVQGLNVYTYLQTLGDGGAFELGNEFLVDVWPDLQPILNTQFVSNAVEVVNLDDPTDFALITHTASNTGTSAGDAMPPFVSMAFRLNRATRDVRHGQKRYMGVSEGNFTNGVPTGAALPLLNAAAAAIEDGVTHVSEGAWELRIGRYGATGLLIDTFPISSVQWVRLSTQNTRKD